MRAIAPSSDDGSSPCSSQVFRPSSTPAGCVGPDPAWVRSSAPAISSRSAACSVRFPALIQPSTCRGERAPTIAPLTPGQPSAVVHHHGAWVDVVFEARVPGDVALVPDGAEIIEVAWHRLDDLPPLTTPKRLYTFTLILPGLTKLTTQLQDALFEAGCDDALLGVQDGVVFLDFSRRAHSADEVMALCDDVLVLTRGVVTARGRPADLFKLAAQPRYELRG